MAISSNIVVESVMADVVTISWTGVAGKTVRIFVNGLLVYGPSVVLTAQKNVTLGVPNPAILEVHENDADEVVQTAGVPLERRPLLWWLTVGECASYNIYIDDQLRSVVQNEPSDLHHEVIIPGDLRLDAGVWRSLHVSALNNSGVEATQETTSMYVPGLPLLEPAALAISGGAGSFDLTITP